MERSRNESRYGTVQKELTGYLERERDLQRRNREATALYELGRQVNSSFDIETLLPALVNNILWILECQFAGLALLTPEAGEAVWRAVSGGRVAKRDDPTEFDRGAGWGGMLEDRQAVVFGTGGSAVEAADPLALFAQREALQAAAVVPLAHADVVFGVLVCGYRQVHAFSTEEIRFLSHLADTTSLGLENARLYQATVENARMLKALTSRLNVIQEEERGRISRELHDGVGQLLIALRLELELLARELAEGRETAPRRIGSLTGLIDETLAEIRQMAFDLRPAILDHSGLPAALRIYADRFARQTGIQIDRVGPQEIGRWDPRIEATVFRVVQESLANVAKHAHATAVTIELIPDDTALSLRLSDNGQGFAPVKTKSDGGAEGQFGILNMRERVTELGGTFAVDSRPGKGTTIRVTIPRSP
jgi:signal transduction histidine kinase